MKKKILLVLLINLVIASCVDDTRNMYTRSGNITFSVDEAKTAFEKEAKALEIKPFTTSATTRSSKKMPIITPLWKNGEVFNNEEGAFAVVPLNIPLTMVFARNQEKVQLSDDEKYCNTNIRLLIQKKRENEYIYTIVHITGDFSHIISRHRSVKSLQLNKLDNFSGEIRYFTLTGELFWGEIYRDGRKAGTIVAVDAPSGSNIQRVQTRGYETRCESHLIEYETCYHSGYDLGEGFVENVVECYYDYAWEDYCYEEWVPDEYGCPTCGSPTCNGGCQSGGSGIGPDSGENIQGANSPFGKKYKPSPGDKFIKNIPSKMSKNQSQVKNTCVFSAISYMAQILGENITQGEAMMMYLKIFKEIPIDGVEPEQLRTLLEAYFKISPCKDVIAGMNNSGIVYATAYKNKEGAHAIVLVGYDPTDNDGIIFMDPLSGYLREEDPSNSFIITDAYTIEKKNN